MTRSKVVKLASAAFLVLILIVVPRMIWTSVQVPVDNHCCAAPNADTLYTEFWLDLSRERGSSPSPGQASPGAAGEEGPVKTDWRG